MAKVWNGNSYNENWEPVDDHGNVIGAKDVEANAAWADATGGQNPYKDYSSVPTAAPKAATPSPWKPVQDQILSDLQLPTTVDQNDPAYRQAVDTNRFNLDRAANRQRAATVQRMAAQGTGTGGGVQSAVTRILGDQGAQEQTYESNLLNSFRQALLDRKSRALQLGAGLMSAEQEQALRAELTREGYNLQRELGMADLNLRRDSLGLNSAFNQAQLNQQAMLALMGR